MGLCLPDGPSSSPVLLLASNQLTGALDVSTCRDLSILDMSSNMMTGFRAPPLGINKLQFLALDNNAFVITSMIDGLTKNCSLLTYLNVDNNFPTYYFDN